MRIVSPRQSMRVPVERGRRAIELDESQSYIMHDVEAASGVRAGAFSRVDGLESISEGPRPFDPSLPMRGELVVPFIGGMGDALCLIPLLRAIRRGWPDLSIHLATTPGPGEVFSLFAPVEAVRRYPLTAEQWAGCNWYLALECVEQTQPPGDALPATFARAVGVELPHETFRVTLPRGAAAQLARIPREHTLIGVATGEDDSPRSYPASLREELIRELMRSDVCVVLFGQTGSRAAALHRPGIADLRNQTPGVLELAVWLSAMDVVIANDSFIMHLAGSLGVPTVGLFAPTSAEHASPYRAAGAVAAAAPCAPCHEAGRRCPKGFDRCIGWESEAHQPASVAALAQSQLRARRVA